MHGHWKAQAVGAVAAIAMQGCGGGGGGGDETLTCLSSYLGASVISATDSTEATPPAVGLTINAPVDGKYFHTATTFYEQASSGTDARQYQGVIVISGNQVAVNEDNDELDNPLSAAGTYSISGISLVLHATCYGGAAVTLDYSFPFTADATSITLYQGHKEMVYTLQPK